jgi:hypothetical protein
MERTAKCLCDQFSVIVMSEPTLVNVCHCHDTTDGQARPGPALPIFQKNTFVSMDQIRPTPGSATQGPGSIITSIQTAVSLFCWTRDAGSTRFGIPVGTFNDPSFPAPTLSVWEQRRCAWSPEISDVKHWDTQPPSA